MEAEVLQTVLTEVLEELKEIKQQDAQLMEVVSDLTNKVDDFEVKLSSLKVSTYNTNLEPITAEVNEGLLRIKSIIEARPRSTTTQYRILLFPEQNAREYYKVVFGKLLFGMMIFLMATYLFSLGKHYIDSNSAVKYNVSESSKYKKVWIDLYKNSRKNMRARMDTLFIKDYFI